MAQAAPNDWVEGCEHYKRYCKFVSPCCNEIYSCHVCHDEKETHSIDKKKVSTLLCAMCASLQPVQRCCQRCQVLFGQYNCVKCRIFDNEDKGQFHCEACGLCRVGGQNNFFHCKKCNLCLNWKLLHNHTCVENASRGNCPVCIEDLHTSRTSPHVPACGHLLHESCFEQLKTSGRMDCPICQAKY